MPNAIAPTDAQINIAKSNKFAIATAFGMNTPAHRNVRCKMRSATRRHSAGQPGNRLSDCRRLCAALTLLSVA